MDYNSLLNDLEKVVKGFTISEKAGGSFSLEGSI